MELFYIKENMVFPTPQALNINVFRNIWEKDKSEKKEQALMEMAFVEFMCSYKKSNPFIGYTDLVEREHKILQAFSSMRNNEPIESPKEEQHVIAAMEFYEQYSRGSNKGNKLKRTDSDGTIKLILKDNGGWSINEKQ